MNIEGKAVSALCDITKRCFPKLQTHSEKRCQSNFSPYFFGELTDLIRMLLNIGEVNFA